MNNRGTSNLEAFLYIMLLILILVGLIVWGVSCYEKNYGKSVANPLKNAAPKPATPTGPVPPPSFSSGTPCTLEVARKSDPTFADTEKEMQEKNAIMTKSFMVDEYLLGESIKKAQSLGVPGALPKLPEAVLTLQAQAITQVLEVTEDGGSCLAVVRDGEVQYDTFPQTDWMQLIGTAVFAFHRDMLKPPPDSAKTDEVLERQEEIRRLHLFTSGDFWGFWPEDQGKKLARTFRGVLGDEAMLMNFMNWLSKGIDTLELDPLRLHEYLQAFWDAGSEEITSLLAKDDSYYDPSNLDSKSQRMAEKWLADQWMRLGGGEKGQEFLVLYRFWIFHLARTVGMNVEDWKPELLRAFDRKWKFVKFSGSYIEGIAPTDSWE